jgi:uncharacterized protein
MGLGRPDSGRTTRPGHTRIGRGRFDLVTSEPIIREGADVLARRRIVFKYAITAEHIDRVVALIRERGELVPVTGSTHLCRDPDDDLVLETALTGEADALVAATPT